MNPTELGELIAQVLRQLAAEGAIALDPAVIPDQIHVERPRQAAHGDWATNAAMQLAGKAQLKPRDLAEKLAARLAQDSAITKAEVAGPGFINLTLNKAAAGELARTIVQAGPAYGTGQTLQGQHVNVEFVSANPTGPIHLAGARWAAVGDAISRLLEFQGAKVTREYYFNDHGAQIDHFAESLLAAAQGKPVPKDGYGGQYVHDIAQAVVEQVPDAVNLPEDQAVEVFRERGVAKMFDEIKQTLRTYGVVFDVYFHEHSLHASGAVDEVIAELKQSGNIYNADGAWWLKSTEYGDDKNRVVIKSDGAPAYIAGDIAYFRDKRQRGADRAIYLLGADHHGYIARLKAAAAALGFEPDTAEVLIGQLVFLLEDGEPVKMSKRAGTVVTLEDLTDAIGVDAARYAMARASIDSTLEIDLGIWRRQSNDNPVFYVQYAHARTCSVARNAEAAGISRQAGFDPGSLTHASEATLLGELAQFPRLVAQAAEWREPHRVARYLETLASAYHKWYDQCRVIPLAGQEIEPVHVARLWLNDATTTVLANGLKLLGVSAPERM